MHSRQPLDHSLKLDGRRVFCRDLPAGPAAGGRPPLLLVHGISCCTGTWRPFVEALARRPDAPRVLVPDLPAHGRSAKPDRLFGMDDYAAWSARLLDQLDAPRVDVMGHSMGCQVALALADRCPDRGRRMVLLGPTTGHRHASTLRNFLGLVGDTLREPFSYNLILTGVFWQMGPLRYLRTIRRMQADDAFQRARRVPAPTLVLQGDRDLIVPGRVALALSGALPHGAYSQVPGAAHAAQFSHPEATAETVLAFLAPPPAEGCVGTPAPRG